MRNFDNHSDIDREFDEFNNQTTNNHGGYNNYNNIGMYTMDIFNKNRYQQKNTLNSNQNIEYNYLYNDQYNKSQDVIEEILVKPRKAKDFIVLLIAILSIVLPLVIIILFRIPVNIILLAVGLFLLPGNAVAITELINERLTKHRCTYSLKGLITDVQERTSVNDSSSATSSTFYLVSFIYFYQGKKYIVKNKSSYINKFKTGEEFDFFINLNNPEDYYIEQLDKGARYIFAFMFIVTAVVIAVTAICILK